MLTMLRFDGEIWEIVLGYDESSNETNVNVRKPLPGRDDKAIANGITYIQSDGRWGKNIQAHEIRRIK